MSFCETTSIDRQSARRQQRRRKANRRGFTLPELVVPFVLLSTTAAVIVPSFRDTEITKSREDAILSLKNLALATHNYVVEEGALPDPLINLGEPVLKESGVEYDPVNDLYLHEKWDYSFEFRALDSEKFELKALPHGEKRHSADVIKVDQDDEFKELAPDKEVLEKREVERKKSTAGSMEQTGKTLAEAPDKEELRKKLLKEDLTPFAELVYKAADTNSDDAVSVKEFKKLAEPDPMDSKSLAESKEQLLKQLAPLEEETKVEISKLFFDPQAFLSAENLAIYLESLDASKPVKISLEGNFKAVDLLAENGHLEAALLLLKVADAQISLFDGMGLSPEDAQISHELIALLKLKFELALVGEE